MSWYLIYETSSCHLRGVFEDFPIEHIPEDCSFKLTSVKPDFEKERWDTVSCLFIPKDGSDQLSKLEFIRRFTPEERAIIRSSTDTIVIDAMFLLDRAEFISKSDPDVDNMLNYFTFIGILASGRKEEILL